MVSRQAFDVCRKMNLLLPEKMTCSPALIVYSDLDIQLRFMMPQIILISNYINFVLEVEEGKNSFSFSFLVIEIAISSFSGTS